MQIFSSLPWYKTPKRAVILSGEARSGTTWLGERLCAGYPFRTMFEPLHPKYVQEAASFWKVPFLPADINAPLHKSFMDSVLTGRFCDHWIDKYNFQTQDKYRLVKFIRANVLLPWLQANYPRTPIIMLIRHPIAVAVSKTRHGWGGPALDRLLECKPLYTALPELNSITPPQELFAKNILSWCIGQAIPLRMLDFTKKNVKLAHYEHVVSSPEIELSKLLPLLPKNFDLEAALKGNNNPSATNARWSPTQNFEASLGNWRQFVSEKQIELTLELLQLFGLDGLYNDSVMPLEPSVSTISSSHP